MSPRRLGIGRILKAADSGLVVRQRGALERLLGEALSREGWQPAPVCGNEPGVNPKRRWMLTVVGVMVLAVFVGVIILLSRKGAANDFGRVTVIKCTVQNGGR